MRSKATMGMTIDASSFKTSMINALSMIHYNMKKTSTPKNAGRKYMHNIDTNMLSYIIGHLRINLKRVAKIFDKICK